MHYDHFKSKSYLKLIKKYVFSEGEHWTVSFNCHNRIGRIAGGRHLSSCMAYSLGKAVLAWIISGRARRLAADSLGDTGCAACVVTAPLDGRNDAGLWLTSGDEDASALFIWAQPVLYMCTGNRRRTTPATSSATWLHMEQGLQRGHCFSVYDLKRDLFSRNGYDLVVFTRAQPRRSLWNVLNKTNVCPPTEDLRIYIGTQSL